MSSPFVAEIRIFPFNFAPKGWAFCAGQLLPISQNTALFSLLGTNYGGDGKATFGLPNLQGRAPIHENSSAGAGDLPVGTQVGSATVALLSTEMPAHSHIMRAYDDPDLAADSRSPAGNSVAKLSEPVTNLYDTGSANPSTMNPQALTQTGGSQPHNNLQPYLVLNFCIALQGVFPARS